MNIFEAASGLRGGNNITSNTLTPPSAAASGMLKVVDDVILLCNADGSSEAWNPKVDQLLATDWDIVHG